MVCVCVCVVCVVCVCVCVCVCVLGCDVCVVVCDVCDVWCVWCGVRGVFCWLVCGNMVSRWPGFERYCLHLKEHPQKRINKRCWTIIYEDCTRSFADGGPAQKERMGGAERIQLCSDNRQGLIAWCTIRRRKRAGIYMKDRWVCGFL